MKRAALLIALAVLAGCSGSGGPRGRGGELRAPPPGISYANPSALVAAELGFARLAQTEGQWTAFRETADPSALMFVEGRVNALDWLKGRADPVEAARWQPHSVFMACDGTVGATTGAAQWPGGSQGYYSTIWKRTGDPRRPDKQKWRWIADHGDTLAAPRTPAEFVSTRIANCTGQPTGVGASLTGDSQTFDTGTSLDKTFVWSVAVNTDLSRVFTVHLWNGSGYDTVIEDRVSAP